MTSDKKALSVWVLGHFGEKCLIEEKWTILEWSRSSPRQLIWRMMRLRGIKQILTSSGKLVSDLGNKRKGELVMSSMSPFKWELPHMWSEVQYEFKHKTDHKSTFCNLKTTYPTYLPNIFSSFWVGALRLADPDYPFFFFFSVLLSKSTLISAKGPDYALGLLWFFTYLQICQD